MIQLVENLFHPKHFYLKHVLGSNSELLKLFDMWTVSPLVLCCVRARALVAVRGEGGGAGCHVLEMHRLHKCWPQPRVFPAFSQSVSMLRMCGSMIQNTNPQFLLSRAIAASLPVAPNLPWPEAYNSKCNRSTRMRIEPSYNEPSSILPLHETPRTHDLPPSQA